VQVEQDFAYCAEAFPNVLCKPVAAQFLEDNLIVMFLLTIQDGEIRVEKERHYRLVPGEALGADEIARYGQRAELKAD
jgi:hypothetical protein